MPFALAAGAIAGAHAAGRARRRSELLRAGAVAGIVQFIVVVGVKLGVRGSYRLSDRFSVSTHLGFSMLDGENSAASSLTLVGQTTPASSSSLSDDGRSGTIRDFDVALNWHLSNDRARIWFGWEQSTWERIASADLVVCVTAGPAGQYADLVARLRAPGNVLNVSGKCDLIEPERSRAADLNC